MKTPTKQTLASQFARINGLRVHYTVTGQGSPCFVLLHGSFLNLSSWRHVIAPLAQHGTVVAFDRITFGQTERPIPDPHHIQRLEDNPYSPEAQADLTIGLMDHLDQEQAILIGNSTGGTIALLSALRSPQRVQALVMVGGMVYSGYPVSEMPDGVKPFLPNWFGASLIGAIIGRTYNRILTSFWHDPTRLPPDILAAYRTLLATDDWNDALWQLIRATHHLHLDERLQHITCPSLVVSGEHDRTVPLQQSLRLASELPGAGLAILPDCGHLPQEECPHTFLLALHRFLQNIHRRAENNQSTTS